MMSYNSYNEADQLCSTNNGFMIAENEEALEDTEKQAGLFPGSKRQLVL